MIRLLLISFWVDFSYCAGNDLGSTSAGVEKTIYRGALVFNVIIRYNVIAIKNEPLTDAVTILEGCSNAA